MVEHLVQDSSAPDFLIGWQFLASKADLAQKMSLVTLIDQRLGAVEWEWLVI